MIGNRSTRNVPVLLDWKSISELRGARPEWAALRCGISNTGAVITVRDTAPSRSSLIYSDQQECTLQE